MNAIVNAMSANVNVGMNEVVSVFVAKYEDGLFAKKDALSGDIRALKAELAQIDNSVAELVDRRRTVAGAQVKASERRLERLQQVFAEPPA